VALVLREPPALDALDLVEAAEEPDDFSHRDPRREPIHRLRNLEQGARDHAG
jgi:hypothetical protein